MKPSSQSYLDSVNIDLTLTTDAQFLLVALHGLTGNIHSVRPYLRRVGTRWGILVPDLRSHGATSFSGEPGDFTADTLASDVISVIDRVNLSRLPIVILGVSLGATVGVSIIHALGPAVRAALFIRPTHGPEEPTHLRINVEIADLIEGSSSLEDCLANLEMTQTFRDILAVSALAAEATRKKLRECFETQRVFRLRAGSTWRVTSSDLAAVGCPSFVLASPGDPLHPEGIARNWLAHLPQGEMVTLPAKESVPDSWDVVAARLVQEILATVGAR